MAKLKVDTDKMQNHAANMTGLCAALDDVIDRIDSVKISGSMDIATTLALRLSVQNSVIAVRKHYDNLKKLAQTLDNASQLYQQHEKKIAAIPEEGGSGDSSTETEPTDPTEGMTYDEILEYRAENAVDENTARLYERYRKKVDINDDSYTGTAHYDPVSNEINYNAEADSTNVRGPGNTYYHEVGHLIDDQSDWNGDTSTDSSYHFYDCLSNDIDAWIQNRMEEMGYTDINDAYDDLSDWLYEDCDMKNGVSDIVRGVTGGDASGPWGHSDSYYNKDSIANEAFAHFFEAGMSHDPTKLEYIKEVFPSAYEEYQRMIQDELGD